VNLEGKPFAGRVVQLSPGMAMFAGSLPAMSAGRQVDLQIDGLEHPLRARYVESNETGARLQLLLNHEHLAFMERALARFGTASAA
jgi:hypothetical protein